MSETSVVSEAVRSSVDRLYWNSDDTVDEVAGRLGLSRHALYQGVHPLPAGVECRDCGGEMVFANRSQRSARRARCPDCGSTQTVSPEDATRAEWTGGGSGRGRMAGDAARMGGAAALGLLGAGLAAAALGVARRLGRDIGR